MTRGGREVPCTRCPLPCPKCRQGAGKKGEGLGPYCELNPCPCACHGAPKFDVRERIEGEIVRVRERIRNARHLLDSVEQTLCDVQRSNVPPSPDVGQAVAGVGSDISVALGRLAAYMHAEQGR